MKRIHTVEEFRVWHAALEPVFIRSTKFGAVLVPCMNTVLVVRDLIVANTYNPNHVSADRMALLQRSILDNGWCFPVVCIWDGDDLNFVIVDGFHRDRIGDLDWLDLDYIPVVVLALNMSQRLAATVQFNKARGVHQVDLDAEVVRRMLELGQSEEQVAQELGMEPDAVHRFKQMSGVVDLFRRVDYSRAWEMEPELDVDQTGSPRGD